MRMALHKIDLNSPKGDDEEEFTTLQLTRLFRVIREDMLGVMLSSIAMVVSVIALLTIGFIVIVNIGNNRNHDQCVFANRGRTEIKQAFSDLYSGLVYYTSPDKKDQAIRFKEDRMTRLYKALPQREC